MEDYLYDCNYEEEEQRKEDLIQDYLYEDNNILPETELFFLDEIMGW